MNQLVPAGNNDFRVLVSIVEETISESSGRIYKQTYEAWEHWAYSSGISPLDLNGPNVSSFLKSQEVSKSTRQRMLSALRTLSDMLAVVDPSPLREVANKTIKSIRVPSEGTVESERKKRALTPKEASAALHVWDGQDNRSLRNAALIATLIMTGVRRSEAASLMWQDVDLEEGVIIIRHGKGDKAREVAIYGDVAVNALEAWLEAQGGQFTYVFCSVNKDGVLGEDVPITPTSVYRIVKETERLACIEHFSPHDARRTLITELLSSGASLADAQAQAGHSQGNTTLRYAQAADARRRRRESNLRFGD